MSLPEYAHLPTPSRRAIAALGYRYIGLYELDHTARTARFLEAAPGEIRGSDIWYGINSEVHGDTLTLLGYPFHGDATYTLIAEVPA